MADEEKTNESELDFAMRLEQIHDQLLENSQAEVSEPLDPEIQKGLQALQLIHDVNKDRSSREFKNETKELQNELTPPLIGTAVQIAEPRQMIGRFELFEQIGKGGYGMVFRARDPDVDRMVALKVPRAQILASKELEARFVREAKAAGALSHPNIVAVFEAGRCDGVCYIASQFVDGMSLAEWLAMSDSLPSSKQIARLVSTLAAALRHAHDRGVLHRDLKPANILLAQKKEACEKIKPEIDAFSQPMIADFGLAKLDAERTEITQSGMIIGTPAYMAPEQTAGAKKVGSPADVYGLGAIMYELLTGRKPFVGATIVEMIRSVKEDPPIAPSKLRADVPPDLEAICLKCLEKESAARYQTATELENDLNRFLNGESIIARPVSSWEKLRRWAIRNAALAKSLFALATVVLLALAVTSVLLFRSEYHRGLAHSESLKLSKEVTAKENALKLLKIRSGQMTRVVDRLFVTIADSPEIRQPDNESLRRRLIVEAEKAYASFLKDTPEDEAFLLDHAKLLSRLAMLFHTLGESKQAEQLMTQVIEEYQLLATPSQNELEQLAAHQHFRGNIRLALGDFEGAASDTANSVETFPVTLEDLLTNPDATITEQFRLAKMLSSAAVHELKGGNHSRAKHHLSQAEQLWHKLELSKIPDPHTSFAFEKATAYWHLGQVAEATGDNKRSEVLLRTAIAILESVDRQSLSDHLGAQIRLSQCQQRLGIALAKQKRLEEARTQYSFAIKTQTRLNKEYPNVRVYAEALTETRYSLAVTEYIAKNCDRATELLRSNSETELAMIKIYPDSAGARWTKIGETYNMIYVIHSHPSVNDLEVAEDAIRKSIDSHQKSLAARPGDKNVLMRLHSAFANQAILLVKLGRIEEAHELLDSTEALVKELLQIDTENERSKRTLAAIYDGYAQLYSATKEYEKAIEFCNRNLELFRDTGNILANFELAWLYAKTNEFEKSKQVLDEFQRDFGNGPIDFVKCANAAARIAIEFQNSSLREYERFLAYARDCLKSGIQKHRPTQSTYITSINNEEFLSSAFDSEDLATLFDFED